ncbi:MAG: BREX-1 system adenine-specific DNA-methyltransferase PglX [Desulfohalobiaceae bacterium]|nr:BREX-1 system adenine-specific DNA-methyltransferase PglX [Desulfohalobiaceae bacterium]
MHTNKLKAYAPQARQEFIQAVTDRAKVLGLSESKIEPVQIQGEVALIAGRPFPVQVAEQRKDLEARIKLKGFDQVMEEVAYTWFNRFMALRYMELHDYLGHGYRVLSNPSGSDIPEILEKATSVDLPGLDQDKVAEMRVAGDKDAELYRLLLITQCNALHRVMPFLFERVSDASELLLPENLLQTNSPIRKMVTEIPEEDWDHIEIVGWLYQFYISEKKSQVIGKTVKSEDIPAATQLFTPNWIVKYMVQNTLGRKWLMTYPDSSIRDKMEFYIQPAEQEPEVQAQLEAITPKELNPEDLTFMDPACGSGHILAEAFDLFKEIYLERGYRTRDIPRHILEHNLYGLDIDDRAAQLARFTVLMKARADDRHILNPERPATLNVMAIQESEGLDMEELAGTLLKERAADSSGPRERQQYLVQPTKEQAYPQAKNKPEVSQDELKSFLHLFQDAKTFGSLLTVPDKIKDVLPRLEKLIEKALTWDAASKGMASKLLPLLRQARLLATEYDFVVANPPYMGSNGLNAKLKEFAKNRYPDSKSDLFAMFIERVLNTIKSHNFFSLITMQSWMFLSDYKKIRTKLLNKSTIQTLGHFPYDGKRPTVMGINFGTVSFTANRELLEKYQGTFFCSRYYELNDDGSPKDFPTKNERLKKASVTDFNKIPGSPIAYWVSDSFRNLFVCNPLLKSIQDSLVGLQSGSTEKFIRNWQEVSINNSGYGNKWVPIIKGGDYRKWYGNLIYYVNWENNGQKIKSHKSSRPQNIDYYFKRGIVCSAITSAKNSFRYMDSGYIFDVNIRAAFPKKSNNILYVLCLCNSKILNSIAQVLNPTMAFNINDFEKIPFIVCESFSQIIENGRALIDYAKEDWELYETSWDFSFFSLVTDVQKTNTISLTYSNVCAQWNQVTQEMQRLEEENNRIFIEAYGLQDELTPDVPLEEITLSCNPYYRYGGNKSEEELETLLRADTMKELISYAIGCMMGRYSLNEPGLIYAHSGNEGFDPSRYQSFPADEDGIIPIMDGDWFADDATNRFVEFIKVAWPPENLAENLKFVADSLDPKKSEDPIETIRRYISEKFFKDHHLKVYKKRPIYWLISSGKHKAFQCLVYLHRYNESTLSRMRAMYVTPLQGKYKARIEYLEQERDNASSASVGNKMQKELNTMHKKQDELRQFDELLRHYADQRISLDLDDGVKVNYGKFGNLLAEVKAVTGKSQS